jgi:rfaE bifunctional protein nucleotidyltransferase chain/domain
VIRSFRQKLVNFGELAQWREQFRALGKRLVVTNGCFDLLHLGHVTYLEQARSLGDALCVGVNSDAAVRGLKGEGRPINSEEDRALVLCALESVSFASIFPDVRATEFLARVQPDIYVKGGDYTLETLNQEERRVVEKGGGRIEIIPFLAGKSTTATIGKLRV